MQIDKLVRRFRRRLQKSKRRFSGSFATMLHAGDWAGLAASADRTRYEVDRDLADLGARLSVEPLAGQPVTVLGLFNLSGNIQHFHHYFGAVILPSLVLADMKAIEGGIVLAPDCGAMNDKLAEIIDHMGCHFTVFPVEIAQAIMTSTAFRQIGLVPHDKCEIADHIMLPHNLQRARRTAFAMAECPGDDAARDPHLLLVDRGPPLAFYSTERYQKGFNPEGVSGSDRRAIANMDDLEQALSKDTTVQRVLPEHMTLREQIACFNGADCIVAQHGAALNSLFWAKPGTVVVEIIPRSKLRDMTFFTNLSRALNLRHHLVVQKDTHGPVDIALVRSILRAEREAVSAPPAPRYILPT